MGKKITDAGIVIFAIALAIYTGLWMESRWRWPLCVLFMAIATVALNNLINQFMPHRREKKYGENNRTGSSIQELILLDENEKPIKAWDLSGKVSLLIGRDNPQEQVDVDLEECECGALIDEQHAVLNYCMDAWYIEDLHSHNGIRVRKSDDGLCYHVIKDRPCRLTAGDLIYIANTKLLIT